MAKWIENLEPLRGQQPLGVIHKGLSVVFSVMDKI